jgi:hypothetical protein
MTGKSIEMVVEELTLQILFKDTVEPGDLILLVEDDGVECDCRYALALKVVGKIIAKESWLQLDLAFLTFPIKYASLSIKSVQLGGLEIVRDSGGRKLFIKAINKRSFLDIHPAVGDGGPDPDRPTPPRPRGDLRLVKS